MCRLRRHAMKLIASPRRDDIRAVQYPPCGYCIAKTCARRHWISMRLGIHFPAAYAEPPQSAAANSRAQNQRLRLFGIYFTIKRSALYGIIGMCRLGRHAMKFQRIASERRYARGKITALRLFYHILCAIEMHGASVYNIFQNINFGMHAERRGMATHGHN